MIESISSVLKCLLTFSRNDGFSNDFDRLQFFALVKIYSIVFESPKLLPEFINCLLMYVC